jgi:anti-sigma B factor antagonist
MTSAFGARVVTGDGFVVVSLTGELDLAEAPRLRDVLDDVLGSPPQLVVIDAAELTFLDSSGIGVLVGAHNALEAAGSQFVIANLAEMTGKPIRLTEVDTAISVHWAPPPVTPWSSPEASVRSILAALAIEPLGPRVDEPVDVDAGPVA